MTSCRHSPLSNGSGFTGSVDAACGAASGAAPGAAPIATIVAASVAALAFTVLAAAPARAASPPDPSADIPWDEDPGQPGEQQRFDGVGSIEAAFGAARRAEERQFELPEYALGTLELPAQHEWDGLDEAARLLLITNAERAARGGVPYPDYADGEPLGLPLAAVETHLDALAQAYADYMLEADYWGHMAPADGPPPFAGSDPFTRIDAHPVLGEKANGGHCHQFLGQAENLAVFASSGPAIRMPVERALYGFLYEDADSDWGHRHLMLLQDVPLGRDSGGFSNDAGSADSEGFIGVGSAGASDGSYAAFADTGTFPVQRNVVVLLIDPVPGDACGYEPVRIDG